MECEKANSEYSTSTHQYSKYSSEAPIQLEIQENVVNNSSHGSYLKSFICPLTRSGWVVAGIASLALVLALIAVSMASGKQTLCSESCNKQGNIILGIKHRKSFQRA